jgi:hypothetical protein
MRWSRENAFCERISAHVMKAQAPFGFVTGCHAGDKFMVQATLASMRHFCPKVPIGLVVDGDLDVSDLERDYQPIVLRIRDLPSAQMRKLIAGGFHAKHAAMWEGPFEFYVWIDSDAIVWGDFTPQIRTDVDFQIFWSEISIRADATEIPTWLPHFYFDPVKLRQIDPNFDWRGHAYFSAGVFACRRNVIPFERYVKVEAMSRQVPGLFESGLNSSRGDMGMLNYLVHTMAQREDLKITVSDLQHIPGHQGIAEFERDCSGVGWRFPVNIHRPRVAHFCGRKPLLFDRKAYSRPFTIARLEHHRSYHSESGAWWEVLNEEGQMLTGKVKRRLWNLFAQSK